MYFEFEFVLVILLFKECHFDILILTQNTKFKLMLFYIYFHSVDEYHISKSCAMNWMQRIRLCTYIKNTLTYDYYKNTQLLLLQQAQIVKHLDNKKVFYGFIVLNGFGAWNSSFTIFIRLKWYWSISTRCYYISLFTYQILSNLDFYTFIDNTYSQYPFNF